MGDTVNVASRLEGLNKTFNTTILVSGSVKRYCHGGLFLRPLGSRKLKGRSEEVEIYELMETGGMIERRLH